MKVTASNAWLAYAVRAVTRWYWFPQAPRERFARLLFHPGRMAPFPFSVSLHGIVYDGDFAVYQDWRVFFLGSFERETVNLLTHVLRARPGSAFLDVGANKGLYSAVMARHCAKVHAFEPFAPVAAMMRHLLARNNIGNVVIHDVALGARAETRAYYPPGGSNIGVGSFIRSHQADASVKPVELTIVRGDDVLPGDGPPIGAVKIDIEGFEAFALMGLRATLVHHRPAVVFEVSMTTASTVKEPAEFAALFPEGYDFFSLSDHSRARTWRLTPLAVGNLLASFGNVLACPIERRINLAPA